MPIVRTTKDDLVDVLRPLVDSFAERKRLGEAGRAYVEEVHDVERMTDRLLESTTRRLVDGSRGPDQAAQQALGDLRGGRARAAALAVLLLPLLPEYLCPSDYGTIERPWSPSAIIFTLLRAAIQSSFFRFYFDSDDDRYRARIVRTPSGRRWRRRRSRSSGGLIFAEPISQALFGTDDYANLVQGRLRRAAGRR